MPILSCNVHGKSTADRRAILSIQPVAKRIGDFIGILQIMLALSMPTAATVSPLRLTRTKKGGGCWARLPIDRSVNRGRAANQQLRAPDIIRANAVETVMVGSTTEKERLMDVTGQNSVGSIHKRCQRSRPPRHVRSCECKRQSALASSVATKGCELAALIAAASAVTGNPVLTAATAPTCFGIAVKQGARGRGTLAASLPDTLYRLDAGLSVTVAGKYTYLNLACGQASV